MNEILLLHGALGNKDQFHLLEQILGESYKTYAINFIGHGRNETIDKEISIPLYGEQIIAWLTSSKIEKIDLFGYSMGGYIALWLARYYPDKINRIVTLGTKLNWNKDEAIKQIAQLNPNKIEEKVPAFARLLASKFGDINWKSVVRHTALLMEELGNDHLENEDYQKIKCPVFLCLGEEDNMVTTGETNHVAQLIPSAKMSVLPNTGHSFEGISTEMIAEIIQSFFDETRNISY